MRKFKKHAKKSVLLLALFATILSCFSLAPLLNVIAYTNNTKLVLQVGTSNNTMSVDDTDNKKVVYKIGEVEVGTVKAKVDDTYLTPVANGNTMEFTTPEYTGTVIQVDLEITIADGYELPTNYMSNGSSSAFNTNGNTTIDINSNNPFPIDFAFQTAGTNANNNNNQEGNDNPPMPMVVYPIVAYFEGIASAVQMNDHNTIIVPENWDSGKVTFKAKIFTRDDGVVEPYVGQTIGGTSSEINVFIEGIANGETIDNTVSGSPDRTYINVNSDFFNYGRVAIHLESEIGSDTQISQLLNVDTTDLINIKADAPISMSYSFGSVDISQAIITDDAPKDLSIFFGNNEAVLTASGTNVNKITKVTGAKSSELNDDGSAIITLPSLSTETSTTVKVTILLNDGSSIVRTINIKRTAIMLTYDDREEMLKAGYVMNKGYLYNNQNHNDSIFNAYLQVIFYKDNEVIGYKQVKINDESIINRLEDNEAWSIEIFGENPIILLRKGELEGANKAGVYLSNGPIDFESGTLPSLEYGIGSGLMVEWEEK